MRAWYSLRSNGKRTACCIVSGMLASSDIVENASGAHLPRPRKGENSDGGVLSARASEVADRHLIIAASTSGLPCNDLAEFVKARIGGNHARMNGVMQLAKHACLRQAVAEDRKST